MSGGVEYTFTYDRSAAADLVGGICLDLVSDYGNDALTLITFRTPVDTGRLRAGNSLEVLGIVEPFMAEAMLINPTEYAIFVHEGTARMPGRPFMAEGAAEAAREHNFIFELSS